MSLYTLFDTPYAQARDLSGKSAQALTFLIKNGPYVIVPESQMSDIASAKLFSSTPMSKMFQDICSAGKLTNFVFLNFTQLKDSIPEAVSYDEITIDGKVIPSVPVPAQMQKCWINLTPVLSAKDSYHGSLILTDMAAAASMIVRAALCQTFDDVVGMWLNPKMASEVIECYASIAGHVCRQTYNLNFEEQKFVETLFATYMAQMLGPADGDLKVPPLLLRCTFLGSANDIIGRLESINQYRELNGDSVLRPAKICEIIAKAGPPRMNHFLPQNFYRSMSASSLDSQTMLVAIDYPPYWVYQMLKNVSGYKNPLISTAMRMNLKLKNLMTQFGTELQGSGVIVEQLNRR